MKYVGKTLITIIPCIIFNRHEWKKCRSEQNKVIIKTIKNSLDLITRGLQRSNKGFNSKFKVLFKLVKICFKYPKL